MKLQPTFFEARGYGRPDLLSFHLSPAMHNGIIGIPLKPHMRIRRRYPSIKGIVQEQIG
jgi:hypothetical protein